MYENNKDLVSIIMSEYNTDIELLKESVDSILKQTYKNIEVILIDDCGSNNVNEIFEIINDERLKIYKNSKNEGLVFSLNRAISLSNGKYIARMDTDDYAYPDRIEKQLDFMKKNPDVDILGSRVDYYDGKKIWGETTFYGSITRQRILKGTPLTHPTVMLRKEKIQNIGGYLNFKRCEDYATWIELFSKGANIYVLEDKLLRYHLSEKDYKKRKLSTRKDFFKLIDTQYKKLNPTNKDIFIIKIKNLLAGLVPYKLIYKYHRSKFKKREGNNE